MAIQPDVTAIEEEIIRRQLAESPVAEQLLAEGVEDQPTLGAGPFLQTERALAAQGIATGGGAGIGRGLQRQFAPRSAFMGETPTADPLQALGRSLGLTESQIEATQDPEFMLSFKGSPGLDLSGLGQAGMGRMRTSEAMAATARTPATKELNRAFRRDIRGTDPAAQFFDERGNLKPGLNPADRAAIAAFRQGQDPRSTSVRGGAIGLSDEQKIFRGLSKVSEDERAQLDLSDPETVLGLKRVGGELRTPAHMLTKRGLRNRGAAQSGFGSIVGNIIKGVAIGGLGAITGGVLGPAALAGLGGQAVATAGTSVAAQSAALTGGAGLTTGGSIASGVAGGITSSGVGGFTSGQRGLGLLRTAGLGGITGGITAGLASRFGGMGTVNPQSVAAGSDRALLQNVQNFQRAQQMASAAAGGLGGRLSNIVRRGREFAQSPLGGIALRAGRGGISGAQTGQAQRQMRQEMAQQAAGQLAASQETILHQGMQAQSAQARALQARRVTLEEEGLNALASPQGGLV